MADDLGCAAHSPHRDRGRHGRLRVADGRGRKTRRYPEDREIHVRSPRPDHRLYRDRRDADRRRAGLRLAGDPGRRRERLARVFGIRSGDRGRRIVAACGLRRRISRAAACGAARRRRHRVQRGAARFSAIECRGFPASLWRAGDPSAKHNAQRGFRGRRTRRARTSCCRKSANALAGRQCHRKHPRARAATPSGYRHDPAQFMVAVDRRTRRGSGVLARDDARSACGAADARCRLYREQRP